MHFLVAGDSWSQGEHTIPFGPGTRYTTAIAQQFQTPIPTHKGLHQYLEDSGHTVTNVGINGCSNTTALIQVNSSLWPDIDHLVYFYTDPLRQASPEELCCREPFELINEHIEQVKNSLSNIRINYPDLKITLIGGCSRLPDELVASATYSVPSMTELVCPGFVDTAYMLSGLWHLVIKDVSPDTLTVHQKEQYSLIISEAIKKLDFWKNNKEFFWPDGQHANRKAHLVLFKHLLYLWK
jgi:hypothetical protein